MALMSERNQFRLPFNPDLPPRVLCPLVEADHMSYYVTMTCTETPFLAFQAEMPAASANGAAPDVSALTRRGHLVVVRGGDGVGKTALLNRCAHWLSIKLAMRDGFHFDFTRLYENDFGDRGAVGHALRISTNLSALAEVRLEGRPGDLVSRRFQELKELRDNDRLRMTDVIDALQFLGLVLQQTGDRGFGVLLPPATSLAEVQSYVSLVPPGVVFFAELDHYAVDGTGRIVPANDVKIVELPIGDRLSAQDVHAFVRDREKRAREAGIEFVPVAADAVDRLMSALDQQITIYQLQNSLVNATEKALADNADEVSYDDLDKFLFAGT
ncbi:hypothetical protein [Actinomadura roseirufa]|uniref:hypothetical protein n=1 Tax=Actinomadura roseirufa TaxID=2094049 RepID=UPI001041ACBD|nr:hypothetical protein [Actinomadura roseirufa]